MNAGKRDLKDKILKDKEKMEMIKVKLKHMSKEVNPAIEKDIEKMKVAEQKNKEKEKEFLLKQKEAQVAMINKDRSQSVDATSVMVSANILLL